MTIFSVVEVTPWWANGLFALSGAGLTGILGLVVYVTTNIRQTRRRWHSELNKSATEYVLAVDMFIDQGWKSLREPKKVLPPDTLGLMTTYVPFEFSGWQKVVEIASRLNERVGDLDLAIAMEESYPDTSNERAPAVLQALQVLRFELSAAIRRELKLKEAWSRPPISLPFKTELPEVTPSLPNDAAIVEATQQD